MYDYTGPVPYPLWPSFAYVAAELRHLSWRAQPVCLTLGYLINKAPHDAKHLNRHFEDIKREKNFDKTAILLALPSPTAHPLDGHMASLVLDHQKQRAEYQDPYGILMPAPLLAMLRQHYPDYSIINHRISQEVADTLSCVVWAIENTLSLAEGQGPAKIMPHEFYRLKQAAGLEKAEKRIAGYDGLYDFFFYVFPEAFRPSCGRKKNQLPPGTDESFFADFWQMEKFPHIAPQSLPEWQHPPLEIEPAPPPAPRRALAPLGRKAMAGLFR
ncbi:MAG TPA: hypothetical protein VHB73_04065 [Alphaproteobacteria bacterium]|nr:hypothetical protein [Alphaproteobacteria bacterium]